MSVYSMARATSRADIQAQTVEEVTVSQSPPGLAGAFERVADWIPAEALTAYVGLLGIIAADSLGARRVIFGVCFLLVIIYSTGSFFLARREDRKAWVEEKGDSPPFPKVKWWRPLLLVIFSLMAFSAYAFALPSTPVANLGDAFRQAMGGLVLILAGLLPFLARLAGIRPS